VFAIVFFFFFGKIIYIEVTSMRIESRGSWTARAARKALNRIKRRKRKKYRWLREEDWEG
jgi:hypothetical protein